MEQAYIFVPKFTVLKNRDGRLSKKSNFKIFQQYESSLKLGSGKYYFSNIWKRNFLTQVVF